MKGIDALKEIFTCDGVIEVIDNEDNVIFTHRQEHFLAIKKDLEILEILKSSITLIENKQMTFGYGKYYLAIRPDVISSDDTIKMIKEWLENE